MIEEVKNYPCIWNVSSTEFRDRPKKEECWKRVAAVLGRDDYSVTKKSHIDGKKDDSDYLFCMSLVGELKELTPKKRKKAKLSVVQLLLDLD